MVDQLSIGCGAAELRRVSRVHRCQCRGFLALLRKESGTHLEQPGHPVSGQSGLSLHLEELAVAGAAAGSFLADRGHYLPADPELDGFTESAWPVVRGRRWWHTEDAPPR